MRNCCQTRGKVRLKPNHEDIGLLFPNSVLQNIVVCSKLALKQAQTYSPNVRKSKVTAFSPRPERGPVDNAVTYAYDARPERSLCKGYVTMQMTVKGKQVKVHIPKFPHDADSQPVLERARKKVAEDRLQQKMPQDIAQTAPKKENTDD